jgi:hypothetical protein
LKSSENKVTFILRLDRIITCIIWCSSSTGIFSTKVVNKNTLHQEYFTSFFLLPLLTQHNGQCPVHYQTTDTFLSVTIWPNSQQLSDLTLRTKIITGTLSNLTNRYYFRHYLHAIVFKHPVALIHLLYTYISIWNHPSSSLHVSATYGHHQVLAI